jgi:hypothetical protein
VPGFGSQSHHSAASHKHFQICIRIVLNGGRSFRHILDLMEKGPISDEVLKDWQDTTQILLDDAFHAAEQIDNGDNQGARRNYVRAVFAAIEGSTYGLKRMILMVWNYRQPKLEPGELEYVIETRFDKHGKSKRYFLPFADNVRLSFDVFAKVNGLSSTADYGGNGWKSLRDAAEIRNRLTHPKCSADLEVSYEDLLTVQAASLWYFGTHNRAVARATKVEYRQRSLDAFEKILRAPASPRRG